MSRRMRTYFYAVLGAIGGLIGWQVSNMLGLSFTSNLYMSEAVVGALVGLCIGLFIGITEGLMTRNIVQAIKAGELAAYWGLWLARSACRSANSYFNLQAQDTLGALLAGVYLAC